MGVDGVACGESGLGRREGDIVYLLDERGSKHRCPSTVPSPVLELTLVDSMSTVSGVAYHDTCWLHSSCPRSSFASHEHPTE